MTTVIFSHGQESGPWGTKIRAMADTVRDLGCAADSIDYQGIADPTERVEKCVRECAGIDDALILVGSSMGGHVATAAADRLGDITQRVVTRIERDHLVAGSQQRHHEEKSRFIRAAGHHHALGLAVSPPVGDGLSQSIVAEGLTVVEDEVVELLRVDVEDLPQLRHGEAFDTARADVDPRSEVVLPHPILEHGSG